MTDWTHLRTERRTVVSPIWIKLRDAFTGRPPTGPLTVALERRTGPTTWAPFDFPFKVTPGGDLAFVNLGRSRQPLLVGTFDVRVTVSAPALIAEAATGDPSVTTSVTAWSPEAPAAATTPTTLRFYPGPTYRYPAGVPLLAGRVVDTAGVPVARVRISSTTTIQGNPLTEEVRSDEEGFFRLPLRWSDGLTVINAALGGRTAAITVSVPADLQTTQRITLT